MSNILTSPQPHAAPKRKWDHGPTGNDGLEASRPSSTQMEFTFESIGPTSSDETGVARGMNELNLEGGGGVSWRPLPMRLQQQSKYAAPMGPSLASHSLGQDASEPSRTGTNSIESTQFDASSQSVILERPAYDFKAGSGSTEENDEGDAIETGADMMDTDEDAKQKRIKLQNMQSTKEDEQKDNGPAKGIHWSSDMEFTGPVQIDKGGRLACLEMDPVIVKPSTSDSKRSRNSRRRIGTPPLSSPKKRDGQGATAANASKSSPSSNSEEERVVVEPIRAALTWHEDEITVYDADDKDDDGTGLNGIGFKPTPAIAHARALKRRQQLQDYRKREEGEARARRNQNRREQLERPSPSRKHSIVRVRFAESAP